MLKKSPWSRDNHNDHAHDLYAVNDDDDDDDDDSSHLGGWFGVGNSCARVQALATWRISRMMEITRKVSKR